jgi:hypothetical protein
MSKEYQIQATGIEENKNTDQYMHTSNTETPAVNTYMHVAQAKKKCLSAQQTSVVTQKHLILSDQMVHSKIM